MPTRIFKFAILIVVLWFIVLCYLGPTMFQLMEDSRKASNELNRINNAIEQLKTSNAKIRRQLEPSQQGAEPESTAKTLSKIDRLNAKIKKELSSKLENAEASITQLQSELNKAKELNNKPKRGSNSANYEILRRRIGNQIKEMWFLVSASYSKLMKTLPETAKPGFRSMLESFGEIERITEHDFQELISMDGQQYQRDETERKLSTLIQKRLHKLQNPKDCSAAKKLVCSLTKGCGYGCQMHHVLYCFMAAYATKRTLVIDSNGWRYSSKGWKAYFQPVSDTCTHYGDAAEWSKNHEKEQVVNFPIVDSLFPRPKQMPQNVPKEFYERIRQFHGHPFVWWIGQFCKYIFKYSKPIQELIDKKKEEMGFRGPIVGVQVRRTDKINTEAAFHGIKEYMYWVELYYERLKLRQSVEKKRVYLATDDPTVLPEAKQLYPEYEFLSDNDISKSAGLSQRYTDLSLRGVVTDIQLLSETDFLVCTFSSQVCRLAYEIMNYKHTDASQRFRSLDDIYYFGGQEEHRVRALWSNEAKSPRQLSFDMGDILGIAGNHWDGQAKALHHRSGKEGLYPAFKVEDVHDVADYPDYSDLDAET
ncbi:alpha-(1,6)-fucosyltransferase-like [Clytia hemisphaerica]|uniref:Alpha-(1,6)-fucosyltransferase n=1 Tax=Clytia hemisphaerica TaxID=252671 RepID=A0A7M5VD15_9CNID|eukprot:TCONS_00013905-protein